MMIYQVSVGKADCSTNRHWKQTNTDVCSKSVHLFGQVFVTNTSTWGRPGNKAIIITVCCKPSLTLKLVAMT